MNITVVGAGYVGLVAACCLAKSGHQIIAVENDEYKLSQLKQGVVPIYEEGLEDILHEVTVQKQITFTNYLREALPTASIVIIAVGTPSLQDGRVDLSQVNGVAKTISELADNPLTVVMKSTVPPGTGKSLYNRYFSKAKASVHYVSNPEFLREGKAVWDWYNTDRIVIGSDTAEAAKLMEELYVNIDAPKVHMDITSAEMVKYASNACLATKISFINEIANLCERVGADIDVVAPAIGMDQRIGPDFLQAGLGYGGSCFPKDTKGLNYVSAFNGYNFNVLRAVIEVNARQRVLAVRKLLQALDGLAEKRIGVLGLAFKPGTDDIREAPALDIIDQLLREGAVISACDPLAIDNARKNLPQDAVEFYPDPYEACSGCEAVLLATEWPEFVNLDWNRIKQNMRAPYFILDGRNVLDRKAMMGLGFAYEGIGRRLLD